MCEYHKPKEYTLSGDSQLVTITKLFILRYQLWLLSRNGVMAFYITFSWTRSKNCHRTETNVRTAVMDIFRSYTGPYVSLTPEEGTDKLSRNAGNQLRIYIAWYPRWGKAVFLTFNFTSLTTGFTVICPPKQTTMNGCRNSGISRNISAGSSLISLCLTGNSHPGQI